MRLVDVLPRRADADDVYEAFLGWAEEQGLSLYPHQEEAAIELFSGNNVILATPTGSGKSMVAIAAHFAAMADDRVTFYTAPIKALVSEKFFALCAIFGAENVGHAHRRRVGQQPRADHLLHGRGAGQHRAARGRGRRHRPGRDGRVPLLRRAAARVGVAGADPDAAAGAVPADVGDARRRDARCART